MQNSSFFTSRFAHGNTDCLKVEGVDSYTDLDYKDNHPISTMAFELLVAMGAVIAITIVSYLLYSFVHKERKYELQKLTERMDDLGDEVNHTSMKQTDSRLLRFERIWLPSCVIDGPVTKNANNLFFQYRTISILLVMFFTI